SPIRLRRTMAGLVGWERGKSIGGVFTQGGALRIAYPGLLSVTLTGFFMRGRSEDGDGKWWMANPRPGLFQAGCSLSSFTETNRISTRLLSANPIRRSIDSE